MVTCVPYECDTFRSTHTYVEVEQRPHNEIRAC